MIGNVARIVPSHWKFLFEPYLIYNSNPEIWFFRPWFKLLLYVLYKTLGFQYYGWLAVNLIFTLATLVLGHLTIVELTGNVKKGLLFIAFFISSIHFHFASLVWVGEGTMNCPQLFLLFLNFYCFSKVINSKKRIQVLGFYLLGCLAFILSLGFKEAAIFHLPFLLILLFNNSTSQKRSLKFKISLLIPFGLITICYLYFRLFLIPFNPGYKPQVNIEFILLPILFLLLSLLLPLFSIWIGAISVKVPFAKCSREVLTRSWYLLFFIPFFVTYMGHGFFSPGWLLAPGVYFAFLIGFGFPNSLIHKPLIRNSLVFSVLASSALVFYQTGQLNWWSWHKPQKQIVEIIKAVGSPQTKSLQIYNCGDTNEKSAHLKRVVGYPDSIQEIFWLVHQTLPQVDILPCSEATRTVAITNPQTLRLKWDFPKFTVLTN
jgi:hypothetical protein